MREKNLLIERDAFQASKNGQAQFWKSLGIVPIEGATKISLFCYAQADLAGLIQTLKLHNQPVQLMVPANGLIVDFMNNIGELAHNIQLCPLPFLSQTDYDKLLWGL